jgi:hypothetical protein
MPPMRIKVERFIKSRGAFDMHEPKNFNEMHFAFAWGYEVAVGTDKHMPGKDGNRPLKTDREKEHFAYGFFMGSRGL